MRRFFRLKVVGRVQGYNGTNGLDGINGTMGMHTFDFDEFWSCEP